MKVMVQSFRWCGGVLKNAELLTVLKSVFEIAIGKNCMENRLIALESKFAFAEDMLDTLSLTVYRQQEQIDQLQQQVRLLYQQMQSSTSADKADAREDVPPHY